MAQASPTPPRILCIWLPNWPLQHRAAIEPALKRQAVLLVQQQGGVQRVAACSEGARRAGVRAGMPAAEARAVLGRDSADAVCLEDDPWLDLEALQQLARWCERFSPRVGWQCLSGPRGLDANPRRDCLYLDATDMGPVFGGERSLLREVRDQLRRQGYAPRLAMADTVGAAWAAARHATARREWARLAPGRVEAALRRWPVLCLRLSPQAARDLHRLGIRRVCQLSALPRASLPARLGREPTWRLDQACGRLPEVILPVRPAADWRLTREVDPPAREAQRLQYVLRQALEELVDQLQRQQQGVLQLQCAMREEGSAGPRPVARIGLFQPSADAEHLEQLLNLKLSRQAWDQPIERLTLQARTAALPQRQAELFDPGRIEPAEVARLIDRLSSRLGRCAVLRPRITADPLPERGCCWNPVTPPPSSHARRRRRSSSSFSSAEASGESTREAGRRPVWLWDPPTPLRVCCDADGAPRRIEGRGRRLGVARCWGPERIETGWWRAASSRRDYYRVETRRGEQYWIFRDLRRGGWFMQGVFG